jgi:uncharacterized protein (DUF2267 family)
MRAEEFIERIQKQTGGESRDQVEQEVAAVLETLGERLDKSEQDNLAAQLPASLKEPLLRRKNTNRFLLEEFYNRVSSRAKVGYPRAVELSHQVIDQLKEAVSAGEIENIVSRLPDEYGELFGTRSPGPLSPGGLGR